MSRRARAIARASRRAGFTLVELAIVVAIIGILASTAGVQYSQFLDRARTARAIVELRGIAAQIEPMGDPNATLPDSLAALGIATVDPWGNPYQYLRLGTGLPAVSAPGGNGNGGNGNGNGNSGQGNDGGGGGSNGNAGGGGGNNIGKARKDRFLVPINSDFDLYSSGPDGRSVAALTAKMSRDDVIRAADGAFYGVAEKF